MSFLLMVTLALIILGLIVILVSVAVMMADSTPPLPVRHNPAHSAISGVAPSVNPIFSRPGDEGAPTENPPAKENVHEHACTR